MSKKPKIDKRLDKLFKDIIPEESDLKPKDKSIVRKKEALFPPAESLSASGPRPTIAPQKAEAVSSPKPLQSLASVLVPPEPVVTTQENENTGSSYPLNFQTGYQDWSIAADAG